MGVVDAAGASNFDERFPYFEQMNTVEPLGLSYTTSPLSAPVQSAGPATLELRLASTAPQTSIWGVISDVTPNGTSNPVATGRLSSDYPKIVSSQSVYDSQGDVVEPYADFSAADPAPIGASRTYYLEFWPIGNAFKAGDRIRVDIIGASGASQPGDPAIDSTTVGGDHGSRLILPYLPGSDLPAALQASPDGGAVPNVDTSTLPVDPNNPRQPQAPGPVSVQADNPGIPGAGDSYFRVDAGQDGVQTGYCDGSGELASTGLLSGDYYMTGTSTIGDSSDPCPSNPATVRAGNGRPTGP
jgi:hypothetical protein